MALTGAGTFVGCASDPEPFPMSKKRRAQMAAAATRPELATTEPANLLKFKTFSVYATPPEGWTQKIHNPEDDRAEHVSWISPTKRTAFGVLYFKLPWAIGHELAFRYGFLPEANRREGPATVVEKYWDPEIEGMRFIVDTKKYRVEAKFFVRGTRGWAAYAGTRNDMPFEPAERELAVAARQEAEFGRELTPPPATQRVQ